METLNQYFSYNSDYNDMINVFAMLYKKMKVIHDNELQIPCIDSNHIFYDNGSFSFENMVLSENINVGRRENLLSLTKLFLGTFLSLSTSFQDFSYVDTEWISSNFDKISSSMVSDYYPVDYFSAVFLEGENLYYDDYLEKKETEKRHSSMSNKNTKRKVLQNRDSLLYTGTSSFDEEESFDIVERKSAFINVLFYPVILGSIFIICFVLYSCLFFLN